jgi:hypothetical protein
VATNGSTSDVLQASSSHNPLVFYVHRIACYFLSIYLDIIFLLVFQVLLENHVFP